MTTDWQEIMAVEDWRRRNRLVEDEIRQWLASLPEDDPSMSTNEMLARLLPVDEIDEETREAVVKHVMKIARHATGLSERVQEIAETGWNKGKLIKRHRWAYRPYKAAPTPPAGNTASSAPATRGSSLVDDLARRVERIEAALTHNAPSWFKED